MQRGVRSLHVDVASFFRIIIQRGVLSLNDGMLKPFKKADLIYVAMQRGARSLYGDVVNLSISSFNGAVAPLNDGMLKQPYEKTFQLFLPCNGVFAPCTAMTIWKS